MSMSGWWSLSSATCATCCTNRTPSRNAGACTSRVMAPPCWVHRDRSPARARSISSCGSTAIVVPPSRSRQVGSLSRAEARPSARLDLVARVAPADLGAQPGDRVVLAVHDAFLHRDDRVVGDVDALGADLRAALGDVAHAETRGVLGELAAVVGVERVHVELGVAQEEARAGERLLVLLVVAYDVADVLAQEALDALAELLAALDVLLHHPALAVLVAWRELRGRDLLGLLVVEGHIGHQVADHREGAHRGDRDRLGRLEVGEPGHAHQPRPAVDLCAA